VKYNRAGGAVRLSCVETGIKNPSAPGNAVSKETSPEPAALRLIVTDTGQGIPKERLARLFSPFERLGAEQSTVEGTGLGLALSKRLVDAMGGTLGMESVVGQGSTFWVELALVEAPTERQDRLESGLPPDLQQAGARVHTVLYIEDNVSNLKLVERILSRRPGIRLLTAMQGGLGITLAREHRPQVILLDVNLPDLEGKEVLTQLRADPKTRAIPVVVISADAMQGQIERLLGAGARAYLTKPIDVAKFLEVLDQTLQNPEGSPAKSHELLEPPLAA